MTRLTAMTRGEALDYAPQWGSYVRAGDPGAYFYSEFPDARHAQCGLDYLESDCLPIARDGNCCGTAGACPDDVRELERLALYLEPIARRVWRVTYDLVMEESAAEGDSAESGFLNRAGESVAARIGEPTPLVGMTFREACEAFRRAREESGTWAHPLEPDCSHGRVGSIRAVGARSVSIHAPGEGMTRASFARLVELLG